MDQVLSFVRTLLNFAGGWVVAKGWTDNGTMTQVIGAVMTLAAAGWGFAVHSDTSK